MTIEADKCYGISEAAKLVGHDRKTLRRWMANQPALFGSLFNSLNGRRLISGETLIKIKNNQLTVKLCR